MLYLAVSNSDCIVLNGIKLRIGKAVEGSSQPDLLFPH